MYLSRLEIFGFKTFAQKVDLHFDDGITNIVGPNGCGKSNIVDALRWALGEQKSSVLRSEKMENVIFNGTKSRKPLNIAEVSLTIQNTKNILPTEYTEVTITRRLYRSGESEYYLNRLPCRLKDINDLFMDTGMGADAYSVIELKMVEQILSDSTEDRRKLFEEAAGITKYKIRRRQTFKKLETTKQDLTRVNDIVSEIEKKVNSLKRQTQKANRYQRLMTQLKREDVRLAHFEFDKLQADLAPLTTQLNNLEGQAEQILGEISRKESDVEAIQTQLIGREQALRDLQLQLENQDRGIKTIEEEILVSRERKTYLQDLIRRYAEEKATLAERKRILEQQIHQLAEEIESLQSQYDGLSAQLADRKTDLAQSETITDAQKTELETYRKESVRLIDEAAKKRSAHQLTRNNIENIERRIADLERETALQNEHSGDALSMLDEHQYAQRQVTEKLEDLRQKMEAEERDAALLRTRLEDTRNRKLNLDAEIQVLNSRIAIVQKAIESHEGFPESVQFLLHAKSANLEYTVADMMSTEDVYKRALDTALGDSFSYLVAGDLESITQAIGRLSDAEKGVATFLNRRLLARGVQMPDQSVLDNVRGEFEGLAVDLVKCDDPDLAKILLNDVVFAKDFATASSLAERYPTFRFITLDGELVKGNYLVRGGRRSRSTDSVIGQRDTLRRLHEQVQRAEQESARLHSQILALEDDQRKAQQTQTDRQTELRATEQELLKIEKEISQREYEQKLSKEAVTRNQDTIDQARAELERFQKMLEELLPEIENLETLRGDMELRIRNAEVRLGELEMQRRAKSESVNEVLSSFLRMEGELNTRRGAIASCRSQISENEETSAKHESESQQATFEIERIDRDAVTRESDLVEMSRNREHTEKKRDQEETDVSSLRETVGKMEGELRKIRRQREDLLSSRHDLEQRYNDVRFEVRSLTERIQRDYDFRLGADSLDALNEAATDAAKDVAEDEIDTEESTADGAIETGAEKAIEEVLASDGSEDPNTFDADLARQQIDDLRRKIKMLGPVNMEAFSEYQIEKERLDTLVRQRQDLLEAESQLLQTIDTINTTAQNQFMEVFDKIRQNFTRIFTSLFVDGEANLEMARDEDVLEANIDILARPTGKKIQHIALLSGGEKTLTAISLLFAIYLVKPSPFCILDEVDAPLDDTNIDKFTKILRDFSTDTQFIVVTHNKRTMESASNIFGITMQEAGVSKVVSVKFSDRDDKSQPDNIVDLINQNQVEVLSQEVKEPPSPSVDKPADV